MELDFGGPCVNNIDYWSGKEGKVSRTGMQESD